MPVDNECSLGDDDELTPRLRSIKGTSLKSLTLSSFLRVDLFRDGRIHATKTAEQASTMKPMALVAHPNPSLSSILRNTIGNTMPPTRNELSRFAVYSGKAYELTNGASSSCNACCKSFSGREVLAHTRHRANKQTALANAHQNTLCDE